MSVLLSGDLQLAFPEWLCDAQHSRKSSAINSAAIKLADAKTLLLIHTQI